MCEVTEILSTYHQASRNQKIRGTQWYPKARQACKVLASAYGLTEASVAGVVASLSPQFAWDTYNKKLQRRTYPNLNQAEKAINNYYMTGMVGSVHFTNQCEQAQRILEGEKPLSVLRGPKVRQFYRAIMGYDNAVVIDRWAWRVARPNDPYKSGFDERILAPVQDAYMIASKMLRRPVDAVQATTWLVIREAYNEPV